jgi:hypothetical protein
MIVAARARTDRDGSGLTSDFLGVAQQGVQDNLLRRAYFDETHGWPISTTDFRLGRGTTEGAVHNKCIKL